MKKDPKKTYAILSVRLSEDVPRQYRLSEDHRYITGIEKTKIRVSRNEAIHTKRIDKIVFFLEK